MINAYGYTAVVCCDNCLKELSRGKYPADAVDNLPPEHWIINGDGERPDEHYCNECHQHLDETANFSINSFA